MTRRRYGTTQSLVRWQNLALLMADDATASERLARLQAAYGATDPQVMALQTALSRGESWDQAMSTSGWLPAWLDEALLSAATFQALAAATLRERQLQQRLRAVWGYPLVLLLLFGLWWAWLATMTLPTLAAMTAFPLAAWMQSPTLALYPVGGALLGLLALALPTLRPLFIRLSGLRPLEQRHHRVLVLDLLAAGKPLAATDWAVWPSHNADYRAQQALLQQQQPIPKDTWQPLAALERQQFADALPQAGQTAHLVLLLLTLSLVAAALVLVYRPLLNLMMVIS